VKRSIFILASTSAGKTKHIAGKLRFGSGRQVKILSLFLGILNRLRHLLTTGAESGFAESWVLRYAHIPRRLGKTGAP